MIRPWLVTHKRAYQCKDLNLIVEGRHFSFFAHKKDVSLFRDEERTFYILIDGYVLPRLEYESEDLDSSPADMVFRLFREYDIEWIHRVKGSFNILIVSKDSILIFSDRIGIKKFFYYMKCDQILISNNLKRLTDSMSSFELDLEAIALYALMNHYIDGLTFLKEIFYSLPASKVVVAEDVRIETYWDCEDLMCQEPEPMSFSAFAGKFSLIVKSYLNFLKSRKVALTLTGGLDSRVILAALLNNGIEPRAFSYGNRFSADVVTARRVAGRCGLEFYNHDVQPTRQWFADLADEIVIKGNSLVNPHRAHRLSAIQEEKRVNGIDQIVFGGYMGGEGIRDMFFDGLSISKFTWQYLNQKGDRDALLKTDLGIKGISQSQLDLNRITNILKEQRYFGPDLRTNQFFLSYLVLGGLHHSQDPYLYHHYIKYPVPIFLDIDFLYMIFRSQYNFLYQNYRTSFSLLRRIKSHKLYCQTICLLAPQMADIPFAKKGSYSAREYVDIPLWLLASKRAIRKFAKQKQYPTNFPLETWMTEYVADGLKEMTAIEGIQNIFNMQEINKRFALGPHQKSELYWRSFTNAIFMYLSLKYYGNKEMSLE